MRYRRSRGYRSGGRRRRRGSSRPFLTRMFNIVKSPVGLTIVAVSMLLPALVPKIGDLTSDVASKIKKQ